MPVRSRPPNRFLPAHSGCVTVTRGEVLGSGQQDLIIIYSKLGPQPFSFPAGSRQVTYQAKQAMLKIVRPGGATQTTPIRSAKAASLLAVAHVNNNRGEAVFMQTGGISSGSWGTIYDAYHGRLVHAGDFAYGGDSGAQAEVGCLPGNPPKLIQFKLSSRSGCSTGRGKAPRSHRSGSRDAW